ncbi:MAG: DUF3885 domain-containing protein [Candidatus Kapaibacteriota bacterium]|jgi:hypothetical protein
MTRDDFMSNWKQYFDNVPLISFCFRTQLAGCWMRIHSLPEAKRYPDTPEEWNTLLLRQNTLLQKLMCNEQDDEARLYLVCGEYALKKNAQDSFDEAMTETLKTRDFTPLEAIDLFQEFPQLFAEGQIMIPKWSEETWKPHQFDNILQETARGEIKPFFVSFATASICAPYEGGMDCILATEKETEEVKKQFSSWLSPFSSGL